VRQNEESGRPASKAKEESVVRKDTKIEGWGKNEV